MRSQPGVPSAGARLLLGGVRFLLRVIGAGLLFVSAGIHFDLFATGYRHIPTIGWLFLLQGIVAVVLGLAILFSRHRVARILAAAGALFALATLAGYLLTVAIGLFGFREVRTGAGIVAGIVEILAFLALALFALTRGRAGAGAGAGGGARGAMAARLESMRESRGPGQGAEVPGGQTREPVGSRSRGGAPGLSFRHAGLGTGIISLVALGLLASALAFAGNHGPGRGIRNRNNNEAAGSLRSERVDGQQVLASSSGQTLYTFAPDKQNKSVCYGTCAQYWPPVAGHAQTSGLPGKFGTIRRTDGSTQETRNGRPLYTYVGDNGPGQANGNNLNLNGGRWFDVPVRG